MRGAAFLAGLSLLAAACPPTQPSEGSDAAARPGDAGPLAKDAGWPAEADAAIAPAEDDALVVASDFPATMACAEKRAATLTLKNTGTATWTEAAQVRLGAVDDSDPFAPGRVQLGASEQVAPGAEKVFSLELTAPAAAGAYTSDWRMVREHVRWFGASASFAIQVTCAGPAQRAGKVRLQGRVVVDDAGAFTPLGATLMWAAWGYKNDRPRLEAALQTLKDDGFDYFRALGVVGDPGDPDDYWAERIIDWRWADYDQVIAGLTDLAWDTYGLRVEWTLIGDGQKNLPSSADRYALVDRFLAMSRGREHKIMHFEIANEAWQNGFEGDAGLAELRALAKYLNDRTDVLVAASAPEARDCAGLASLNDGGATDLATVHYDRDLAGENGHWGPVLQPWWPYADCAGFTLPLSNNEPVGPGSSVTTEADPAILNAAAIATFAANNSFHVFHSSAGVRGFETLASMAGVDAFKALESVVPQDVAGWQRRDGSEPDAPFRFFAVDGTGAEVADQGWPQVAGATAGLVRAFGQVGGAGGAKFFVFPFGILNKVPVAARRAVDFDVVDPMTGAVLEHKTLAAGDRFELAGRPAFVLKGELR